MWSESVMWLITMKLRNLSWFHDCDANRNMRRGTEEDVKSRARTKVILQPTARVSPIRRSQLTIYIRIHYIHIYIYIVFIPHPIDVRGHKWLFCVKIIYILFTFNHTYVECVYSGSQYMTVIWSAFPIWTLHVTSLDS